MVEIAKELELEGALEDVAELLQFYGQTWMEAGLLRMNEQRMWFLEIKTTPDEDARKWQQKI